MKSRTVEEPTYLGDRLDVKIKGQEIMMAPILQPSDGEMVSQDEAALKRSLWNI